MPSSDLQREHLEASPARREQALWAARPLAARVRVLRKSRGILSGLTEQLAAAMPQGLARTHADTRVAEILPLLAACKFLEGNAAELLATRRLGTHGLPFWLAGVQSEIQRVPYGQILVIGPSNYPLFLPGVQALQALCAGNSVVWKPGLGGKMVADLFAQAMSRAGLPDGLLRVTDDSVDASVAELERGADKIFFTGSHAAAQSVLTIAAKNLTPCVIEASGCDAVIVLPSADLQRVIQALTFGMRLNGSATCMAPRRVLLMGGANAERRAALIAGLVTSFNRVRGVAVGQNVERKLRALLEDAVGQGAMVHGVVEHEQQRPLLVTGVLPTMQIAAADIFAPVLSVIDCADEPSVLAAQQACPFGLTAALFGDEADARRLGDKLAVGTILVNDLIVPTADPRVPFGGRRGSGFGATRGVEGLLEMTAVKTVLVRRGDSRRHYEETSETHGKLFDGMIGATHGKDWRERWNGVRKMFAAGRRLK